MIGIAWWHSHTITKKSKNGTKSWSYSPTVNENPDWYLMDYRANKRCKCCGTLLIAENWHWNPTDKWKSAPKVPKSVADQFLKETRHIKNCNPYPT